MKKAFAIFLLVVFALNTVGLYGVFLGMQSQVARDSNNDLDQDRYAESNVLKFALPVYLPYGNDDPDYKRVTGDFEHNGEIYRLLKQKFSHDTLYVVCVRDANSKVVNDAVANYVKTFTDKAGDTKNQSSKIQLPSFSKDFMTAAVALEPVTSGWHNEESYTNYLKSSCLSCHTARIKNPPRSFSRA